MRKYLTAGQPPKYETPEELQVKINEYFDKGVNLKEVIIGPPNNRQKILIKVPTITGLCLYLGFESRQSFYAYEKRPKFCYTIKKARLSIEREYEEQLQTNNPTGAIFALKNFDWKDDKTIVDQSSHLHITNIKQAVEYANNDNGKARNRVLENIEGSGKLAK